MSHDFEPHHVKPCHPDCHRHGTCDRQFGRCMCPFGFTGPTCEDMALPACRVANLTVRQAQAAGQDLTLTCATSWPRNCECARWVCRTGPQLAAHMAPGSGRCAQATPLETAPLLAAVPQAVLAAVLPQG